MSLIIASVLRNLTRTNIFPCDRLLRIGEDFFCHSKSLGYVVSGQATTFSLSVAGQLFTFNPFLHFVLYRENVALANDLRIAGKGLLQYS